MKINYVKMIESQAEINLYEKIVSDLEKLQAREGDNPTIRTMLVNYKAKLRKQNDIYKDSLKCIQKSNPL